MPILLQITFCLTRQNFEKDSISTFEDMAMKGLHITNRIVLEELKGKTNADNTKWIIPLKR